MPAKHVVDSQSCAARIQALRKFLNLSVAELAKQLACFPKSLSNWEAGIQEPAAEAYIKLGNLAGDPSCWFFWSCAGLYSADLMQVLPPVRLEVAHGGESKLSVAHAGGGRKLFSRPQLYAIPLLPVRVATVGMEGDRIENLHAIPAEGVIAAPSTWCPNPAYTSCLRVQGNSMAPLICDGYIIVVDTLQAEREKLNGQVVVAWEKKHGLVISRFVSKSGQETLVSDNPQYEPMVEDKSMPWRIVGKVLWWVGQDSHTLAVSA